MLTDEMLTVEQAAERLQVHPETMRRYLRTGVVKGVRPGSERLGWRVAASDLQRFMAGERDGE